MSNHDPNCIFCKIIASEIPAYKIYEDEYIFSFLDINPLSEAHLLVIPKTHEETIDTLPEQYASAIGRALPKLAKAVKLATDNPAFNILQNNHKRSGQEVPHVHFHIIPRTENDNLGYRWHPKQLDEENAQQLIADITAHL